MPEKPDKYAHLDITPERKQELEDEDAFLDAPVTTRTLLSVVAHAVQVP